MLAEPRAAVAEASRDEFDEPIDAVTEARFSLADERDAEAEASALDMLAKADGAAEASEADAEARDPDKLAKDTEAAEALDEADAIAIEALDAAAAEILDAEAMAAETLAEA